jgi:hypothetical protein
LFLLRDLFRQLPPGGHFLYLDFTFDVFNIIIENHFLYGMGRDVPEHYRVKQKYRKHYQYFETLGIRDLLRVIPVHVPPLVQNSIELIILMALVKGCNFPLLQGLDFITEHAGRLPDNIHEKEQINYIPLVFLQI